MNFPRIGISLGDPGGIGPEITLKALNPKSNIPPAHFIIFGSSKILDEERKNLGITEQNFAPFEQKRIPSLPFFSIYELKTEELKIKKGLPSQENGQASFLFFEKAVEEAKKGTIDALVTAPISKFSWHLAGIKWTGHTDYLNHIYPQCMMAFWSEKLKVVLFTHHLPLMKALKKIKRESLQDFFILLDQNLKKISLNNFELLVCGLNPHAGEENILGREEKEEIIPALKKAVESGVRISGPYPPDTIFRNALDKPDKIVVALYHDQGLIPFKLIAFRQGVNLTLGLPFIRTSPDHGTAFDIAGKRKANEESMLQAIWLAYKLSQASL